LKKIIYYIVFAILTTSALLPGKGINEMHKIPSLLHHYHQHKQESAQQLSFIDFLTMHYEDSSAHKHQENHEDLPLFHGCCNTPLFISELSKITIFKPCCITIEQSIEVNSHYCYRLNQSIFQPPRV